MSTWSNLKRKWRRRVNTKSNQYQRERQREADNKNLTLEELARLKEGQ